MLHFLVLKIEEHKIKRIREIKKIRRIKEIRKIEKIRRVKKAIAEIR